MQRDSFFRIGSLSLWGRVGVGAAPTGGCTPTLPSPTEAVAKGPSRPPASTFVIPAQAGIQRALGVAGRRMRCLNSRLRGNDSPFATPPSGSGKFSRQRGLSLIEFMVGLTIGLLVILAAVASLIILRGSSRTMTDSAALEQQATLAMLQISQQLRLAGAYNAFKTGTNPNGNGLGNPPFISDTGLIQFDTRPIGVTQNSSLGTTFPLSTFTIFGIDGDTGTPPTTKTDTLYISYGIANDNSPANNCRGDNPDPDTNNGMDSATDPLVALYGPARRSVSVFTVDNANNRHNLTCDTDPAAATGALPIAANVIDMRVSYLSIAANGDVKYYRTAKDVTNTATAALGVDPKAANTWTTINGVQVCLELVGDSTQAGEQPLPEDCQGNKKRKVNDGRLHRIIRNTFYLRNPLQTS